MIGMKYSSQRELPGHVILVIVPPIRSLVPSGSTVSSDSLIWRVARGVGAVTAIAASNAIVSERNAVEENQSFRNRDCAVLYVEQCVGCGILSAHERASLSAF